MHNNDKAVESWMFREKNEILYLVLTIIIVSLIGVTFAKLNFRIFVAAVIFGFFYVKLKQAQLIGNALEVTEGQFPEIYKLFARYKHRLGIKKVNLYMIQDPNPNAFTIGFPTASIVVASSLLENLSDEEIAFTLAHELGHVKAGHNIILTFLSPMGNSIPGSSTVFSFWRRKAEYTGDRCGLTLTAKLDPAIRALLKLSAGMHLAQDINLASYKSQLIHSNTKLVKISEWLFDHPLTTNRINRLIYFWKKNFHYQ